jgi:hypothetical protein
MKLAVKKEPGIIPGSGFHYMLHPMAMQSDQEAAVFELMGHIILDVSEDQGKPYLEEARKALNHQVKIAFLTDAAEKLRKSAASPAEFNGS